MQDYADSYLQYCMLALLSQLVCIGTAIPGPEFFGLTNPSIVRAIEQLDSDQKCCSYWQGKKVTCVTLAVRVLLTHAVAYKA